MSHQLIVGLPSISILAQFRARLRYDLIAYTTLVCCVVGCNKPTDMLPVHGQVLYQGEPLAYGSVMFQPTEQGDLARGKIQEDGTFVLTTNQSGDGVRIGTCRVRVAAFEAQRPGGAGPVGEDEPTLGRSAIPSKYQSFGTSELTVEVTPEMELPVVLDLK